MIYLDDTSWLWLSALGSTLLISIAPYFILFFIPVDNSPEYKPWLKVLLSFASGGLLGDAFLHLIPHAIEHSEHHHHHHHEEHHHEHEHGHHGHEPEHHHDHEAEPHVHDLSVGLWVLAGLIVFLLVEKFVRIANGPGHGHSHGHGHSDDNEKLIQNENVSKENQEIRKRKNKKSNEKTDSKDKKSGGNEIRVSGYLNLAADFTHNLTDGLAIGASFLAGKSIGMVTTITILLHEIPHEIGDFAILIQSGCSRRRAIQLQLITAFGAFTGTFISLFAEGYGDAASYWILPFTAGGFIYIATVSVIPELLEDTSLWQSIKEVAALILGVLMMILIAKFE